MRYSLILLLLTISMISKGQLSLADAFTDHMVLQRHIAIPIWGRSYPNDMVSVKLGNSEVVVKANQDGEWSVSMPSMNEGGPYELRVSNVGKKGKPIVCKDVLIGDVWLASGQSNMEWEVRSSMNAREEIANATNYSIRYLKVPHDISSTPKRCIGKTNWKVIDTTSVKECSAVAYFFSKILNKETKVPIGIIQSTWGGTPVEAWTSREMLSSCSLTHDRVAHIDTFGLSHFQADSARIRRFWEIVYHPDEEVKKMLLNASYEDKGWGVLSMPSLLKEWNWPSFEGIIWLRKDINIPADMFGKDLTINLGRPELNYSLYFNETEICKTIWNAEPLHKYLLPKEIIKQGKNIITVRLSALWHGGGFDPPAERMVISDGIKNISIAGDWKFNRELEPPVPQVSNYQKYPSFLFNAMINPLIPYGIKGVIWYQGEDNVRDSYNYRFHFVNMINDWRIRFKQGYLPFYFVQLANFIDASDSDWPLLRESQEYALALPNTGMACIIDIGDANNIHPVNKQEVGLRLAKMALKDLYGKSGIVIGPRFKAYKIDGPKIFVEINDNEKGLVVRSGSVASGFEIAGVDGKYIKAIANVKGNIIEVSSENVANPRNVRYAWKDNPDCNVFDTDGNPLWPFRTDKN